MVKHTVSEPGVLIYRHDPVVDDATLLHVVEVAVLDGADETPGGTSVGTYSRHEPLHLQGLWKTTVLK